MGSIARLKYEIFDRLIEQEDFFLVVINPEAAGVDMPVDLIAAGQPVGINLGLRMAIPIPDLVIDEQGISGTLSFNRIPYFCTFPWSSVMQVSAGLEHLIWVLPPEDVASVGPTEPAASKKPRLKLV